MSFENFNGAFGGSVTDKKKQTTDTSSGFSNFEKTFNLKSETPAPSVATPTKKVESSTQFAGETISKPTGKELSGDGYGDSTWTKVAKTLLPKSLEDYFGLNAPQRVKDIQAQSQAEKDTQKAIINQKLLDSKIDPTTGKLPKQTFADVFKETSGEKYVPFVAAVPTVVESTQLYQSAQRLKDGTNTAVDDYRLAKFKADSERDSTFGAKVANVLVALPSFAGELYATGGVYTAGKKATEEAILKVIATSAEKSALRTTTERIGTKVVANTVGGTIQTIPARTLDITAGTIQNMTPQYQYTKDEQGKFTAFINKEGDGAWLSATKAFSDQWVEVVSEHSGGIFNEVVNPVAKVAKNQMIKLGLFKSMLKLNPTLTSTKFLGMVQRAGFDGLFAEMGEERIGDAMHGILYSLGLDGGGNTEFKFPTKEQLAVELVAFSVPSVGVHLVNKSLQAGSFQQDTQTASSDGTVPPPDTTPQPKNIATDAELIIGARDLSAVGQGVPDIGEGTLGELQVKLQQYHDEMAQTVIDIKDAQDTSLANIKTVEYPDGKWGTSYEINTAEGAVISTFTNNKLFSTKAEAIDASKKNLVDYAKQEVGNVSDKVKGDYEDIIKHIDTARNDIHLEVHKGGAKLKEGEKVLSEATASKSSTPREVAKDFIRAYVARGDSLKSLRDGQMGESNKDGHSISIGGYINGKKISTDKIVVEQINGKKLKTPYVVSLREVYAELKDKPAKTKSEPLSDKVPAKETQTDKVKKAVSTEAKSIKEIARETKIKEPNIRRILGVGAKEGTFERVEDGVYVLSKDGQDLAYVETGNAIESLPRLAKSGFKADMVFLDIPYDTTAVKGGSRGVKYSLISVADFGKVLDAVGDIAKDKNTPVIHMFSQAVSGMKEMEAYNNLFIEKGFKPVGKGEYQKTYKDGKFVAFPTSKGSMVTKPEGIIVFTKSGELNKDLKGLNFTLVRPNGYHTEKPAEMLKAMIEMTTEKGDMVLDPFAGSGVTGAEAVKSGRKSYSIEKDAEVAKNITKPRIKKAVEEAKVPVVVSEARQYALDNIQYYFDDIPPQFVMIPDKYSSGYTDTYRTASNMPNVDANLKKRALFNSVRPYWEAQTRPTKGVNIQALYDELEKIAQGMEESYVAGDDIEAWVDGQGAKFRTEVGATDLAVYSGERNAMTVKFLENPLVKAKDTAGYTFLFDMSKSTSIGIGEYEREIVQNVLNTQFKDQKKIDMAEFRRAVVAQLMPLDIIKSTTYANYGSDNVGLDGLENTTYILNSPFDHGVGGHFSYDFVKTLALDDVEVKEIPVSEQNPTAKFAVVKKGVVLTEENANRSVFTIANSEEQANDWIKSHISTEYSKEEVRIPLKKGLFAHVRTFDEDVDTEDNGAISHVAEIQSDAYQHLERMDTVYVKKWNIKNKIKETTKDITQSESDIQKFKEQIVAQEKFIKFLKGKDFKKLGADKDVMYFTMNTDVGKEHLKEVSEKYGIDEGLLKSLRYGVWDTVDGRGRTKLNISNFIAGVEKEVEMHQSHVTRMEKLLKGEREILQEQETELANVTDIPTDGERLFMQFKNSWHQRAVREIINMKANGGFGAVRFPTPRTVSLIEGFASGGFDQDMIPYEYNGTRDTTLEVGETIDYGGEEMTIVQADNYTIEVAPSDKVSHFNASDAQDEDVQYKWDDTVYDFTNLEKAFGTIDTADKAQSVTDSIEVLNRLVDFNNIERDVQNQKDQLEKNLEQHITNKNKFEEQINTHAKFQKLIEGGVITKEKITSETITDLAFKDRLAEKYGISHPYWNYIYNVYLYGSNNMPSSDVKTKTLERIDVLVSDLKVDLQNTLEEIAVITENANERIKTYREREKPTPAELKQVPKVFQGEYPSKFWLNYETEQLLEKMTEYDPEETFSIDDFESDIKDDMNNNYDADYESMYGKGNVFYQGDGYNTEVWLVEDGGTETLNQPDQYDKSKSIDEFKTDDFEGEQRTVLEFYEKQINPYLAKLRKDNLELITDDNGNQWYETKITPEDKNAVTVYRMKDNLAEVGINITTEKEQDIMKLNRQIFGDSDVNFVEKIMANGKALGSYKDRIIKILKGQADAKDTYYHEAVHKYLAVFAERKEYVEILKLARTKYGIKDLGDVEEKVAEGIIEYAKTRQGFTGRLKLLIDRIMVRINNFFDNTDKINELYINILTGQAKNKQGRTGATGSESFRGVFNNDTASAPQSLDGIKPMEMPEMVRLARKLTGSAPEIKVKMGTKLGYMQGVGDGRVVLRADQFKQGDEKQVAKLLAHELGHLTDWIPDKTLARGNLLGHLQSLRKFMSSTFDRKTGEAVDLEAIRKVAFKQVLQEKNIRLGDYLTTKSIRDVVKPDITALYNKMVDETGAIKNSTIKAELTAVTEYWRPYNKATADAKTKKYRTSSKEVYADTISMLFNDPALLEKMAPTFYKEFFDALDNKPDFKVIYFDLQELISGDTEGLYQARKEDIRTGFAKAEAIQKGFAENKKNAIKRYWERLRQQLDDINYPINKKQTEAEARGVIFPESENPKFLLQEESFVDNENFLLVDDLDKNVIKPLEEAGMLIDDIGEYLLLNRIQKDRADIANPFGFNPKNAGQQLDHLRKQVGDTNFAMLETKAQYFHDLVFKSVEEAVRVGSYNRETFETVIKPNKDSYASFQVVDYMQDFIPATVKGQVGTLKEVANPFVSTMLKTIALNRMNAHQRAKTAVVKMLQEQFPDEITPSKVITDGKISKFKKDVDPSRMTLMVDGKLQGYDVDPYIAESFTHDKAGNLNILVSVLDKINNTTFKPIVTTYSLGFALWNNPIRDFKSNFKKIKSTRGGILKDEVLVYDLLKAYVMSVPSAFKYSKGQLDEFTRSLVESKAINAPINDYNYDPREDEMGRILEKYGIVTKDEEITNKKMRFVRKTLLKPVIQLLEGIRFMSNTFEVVSKIAGSKVRSAGGEEGKQLAYNLRNFTGTPNWKTKGTQTNFSNAVFVFSNIMKEGVKADYRIATNPSTRSGYWIKTVKVDILPKMLMFLASIGLLGDWLKELFDNVSEYDKTNYTIIPVGEKEGKTVYVRIPHDEMGRLFSASFWKMANLVKDGGNTKDLMDIFSISAGQLPSMSPVITIGGVWGQYLSGRNPYDDFRGRNIIDQTTFDAGGVPALKKMVQWTTNNFGLTKFATYDTSKNTTLDTTMQITPLLSTMIKISDYGQQEKLNAIGRGQKKLDAQQTLKDREVLAKYVALARVDNGTIFTASKYKEALIKEALGGHMPQSKEEQDYANKIMTNFKIQLKRGLNDDPRVSAILSSTSNNQKLEILKSLRADMSIEKWNTFRTGLLQDKIITNELLFKLR